MRTYNSYKKENQPSIDIPSYSPILPDGVKMFPEYLEKLVITLQIIQKRIIILKKQMVFGR